MNAETPANETHRQWLAEHATYIHGFVTIDHGGDIGQMERTARRHPVTLDVEVLVSPSKGWRPATIAEAWTWHHA